MNIDPNIIAQRASDAWRADSYALAHGLYSCVPTGYGLHHDLETDRQHCAEAYTQSLEAMESARDALEYTQDPAAALFHLRKAQALLPQLKWPATLEQDASAWEQQFQALRRARAAEDWPALLKVAERILERFPENREATLASQLASTMTEVEKIESKIEQVIERVRELHRYIDHSERPLRQPDHAASWGAEVSKAELEMRLVAKDLSTLKDPSEEAPAPSRISKAHESLEKTASDLDHAFVKAVQFALRRNEVDVVRVLLGEEESPYRGIFPGISAHFRDLGGAPMLRAEDRKSIMEWVRSIEGQLAEIKGSAPSSGPPFGNPVALDAALRALHVHVSGIAAQFHAHLDKFMVDREWNSAIDLAQKDAFASWVSPKSLQWLTSQKEARKDAEDAIEKHWRKKDYAALRKLLWDVKTSEVLPSRDLSVHRDRLSRTLRANTTSAVIVGVLLGLFLAACLAVGMATP